MGFNSVLVVLNDRLHEIENDPAFGKKVVTAIREHGMPENHPRTYFPTGEIVSVHHADNMAVIAVGGNTGRVMGWGFYSGSDEDLLKGALAQAKAAARRKSDAPA